MTVVGAIPRAGGPELGLVGSHPRIAELRDAIRRAARLDAGVVVWGPTGSGKELVARALHDAGAASHRIFLPINVAALPETLVDSELFGCVRGAFTGAVADRPGLFEAAHGGTLFLDEAADLAPALQLKLLRVLESGEIRRVGATQNIRVGVRLVVATQESPQALKAAGMWREDLYYRLVSIVLQVPPLRDHRSDIPALVEAFLSARGLPGIAPAAVELLTSWDWPGNVRELQQVLVAAAFIADSQRIDEGHVRSAMASIAASGAASRTLARGESSDAEQANRLLAACAAHGWNLRNAAKALGVARATLYRRLRSLGVAPRLERRHQRILTDRGT